MNVNSNTPIIAGSDYNASRDANSSTQSEKLLSLEKSKPELGGSGSNAMTGEVGSPIIAKPDYDASRNDYFTGDAVARGFIKQYREALDLLENDPNAFLLLTLIAQRALRKESKYNKYKLQPGQAFIGDYSKLGLTEQEYREAKTRIEQKHRLATFKGTNKGTIATLLGTEIYDINQQDQQRAEQRTNNGPTTTKEECKNERKKKDKVRKSGPVATEDGMRLCLLFVSSLHDRLPDVKIPPDLQKWAVEFDKLLKKQTTERIEQILAFLPTCFYHANVQSPAKFRTEFARLCGYQAESLKPKKASPSQSKKQKLEEFLAGWNIWGVNVHLEEFGFKIFSENGYELLALKYSDSGFYERVESFLRKRGIEKKNG